ncbi:unnamed protein product [Aspergillus oryzae var. brunneus]|uniref:Unnamed protein product n=2 Tax=Aspergillus oryzae TaxID=5062 RepID=A0AAN4YGJ1_ASPOZ|nr:unnamed protein product [Aspergillus oryzae]GMG47371.1 unnamed protein product [Aspergillus oryzae var. brunneus]
MENPKVSSDQILEKHGGRSRPSRSRSIRSDCCSNCDGDCGIPRFGEPVSPVDFSMFRSDPLSGVSAMGAIAG